MTIGQREVINYETCIIRASQSSSHQNEVGKKQKQTETRPFLIRSILLWGVMTPNTGVFLQGRQRLGEDRISESTGSIAAEWQNEKMSLTQDKEGWQL